jgi:hypothetical protein
MIESKPHSRSEVAESDRTTDATCAWRRLMRPPSTRALLTRTFPTARSGSSQIDRANEARERPSQGAPSSMLVVMANDPSAR